MTDNALLLSIESSTRNCSVALSQNGQLIALKEASSDQFIHSEKLHLFIEELFKESNTAIENLSGVVLGKGPGSYTGLRIGASAAKGLCFALKIPLMAIGSLDILATKAAKEVSKELETTIIPMFDARRMEVYCATYDHKGSQISDVEAKVLDEHSFASVKGKKIYLVGDGVEKCRGLLKEQRIVFGDVLFPSASELSELGYQKFLRKEFEELAYFEPWYFKEFIAGKPKKLL